MLYADASALVKLFVEEPETAALGSFVTPGEDILTTSAIARVEVVRAVAIADPVSVEAVEAFLESCRLVAVTERVLRRAAALASPRVRALDAIHLASAERVAPAAILVYDERLADAARERGLEVVQPGR